MKKSILLILLLFYIFLLSAFQAQAKRGLNIKVKIKATENVNAPVVEEVDLYGESHALVIGIDKYTQGWPRLSEAVNDAELVADELRKKGFNVTFKENLDSRELKQTFEEFFILKGENPQARLFVWFAGHGHTLDREGFLIPADAPRPDEGARFKLKALSMRRFGEFVRLAQSKHAFAVFDSCFSGTIFDSQRTAPPPAITRATTLAVRQFLTSGDADQKVSDDGRFRKLFIRALRGEEKADANGDGYLTGSELGMFLTDRITNLTQARQTPRYGKLRDENYDIGDFVFLSASSGGTVKKPSAPEVRESEPKVPKGRQSLLELELEFWKSIKNSKEPDEFEAYLEEFPEGKYARLAKIKIKKLKQKEEVASIYPEVVKAEKPKEERVVRQAEIEDAKSESTDLKEFLSRLEPGQQAVIIGSFRRLEDAKNEVARMKAGYPELFSVQTGRSQIDERWEGIYTDGRYFIVYIGGLYSVDSANALRRKAIEELGARKDSFIRNPYRW